MTQKKSPAKKLTPPMKVPQASAVTISNCDFKIEALGFNDQTLIAITALADAAKANAAAISDIAAMIRTVPGSVAVKIEQAKDLI